MAQFQTRTPTPSVGIPKPVRVEHGGPTPTVGTPKPGTGVKAPTPPATPSVGIPKSATATTAPRSGMVGPITSGVDARNETIEGRLGGLLRTDANGNYTSQYVRQAVDRQDQAFNARGLRNSSMALQAGQEAAISRAIDVAAPDARTYYDNRRSNLDITNQFGRDANSRQHETSMQDDRQRYETSMQNDRQRHDVGMENSRQLQQSRRDYTTYVQTINSNFQRQIDTINASNMTPQDKSIAIQQATIARDGEIAFANNLFNDTPGWESDWLADAVPVYDPAIGRTTLDISRVTNMDMLANIANDPSQDPRIRRAATDRLNLLQRQAPTDGGAGSPGGGGGTASNGYTFPTRISGVGDVNWNQTQYGGKTLKQQYEEYARSAGRAAMTPEEWIRQQRAPGMLGGSASGQDGSAAAGAAAAAAGANAASGVGVGVF